MAKRVQFFGELRGYMIEIDEEEEFHSNGVPSQVPNFASQCPQPGHRLSRGQVGGRPGSRQSSGPTERRPPSRDSRRPPSRQQGQLPLAQRSLPAQPVQSGANMEGRNDLSAGAQIPRQYTWASRGGLGQSGQDAPERGVAIGAGLGAAGIAGSAPVQQIGAMTRVKLTAQLPPPSQPNQAGQLRSGQPPPDRQGFTQNGVLSSGSSPQQSLPAAMSLDSSRRTSNSQHASRTGATSDGDSRGPSHSRQRSQGASSSARVQTPSGSSARSGTQPAYEDSPMSGRGSSLRMSIGTPATTMAPHSARGSGRDSEKDSAQGSGYDGGLDTFTHARARISSSGRRSSRGGGTAQSPSQRSQGVNTTGGTSQGSPSRRSSGALAGTSPPRDGGSQSNSSRGRTSQASGRGSQSSQPTRSGSRAGPAESSKSSLAKPGLPMETSPGGSPSKLERTRTPEWDKYTKVRVSVDCHMKYKPGYPIEDAPTHEKLMKAVANLHRRDIERDKSRPHGERREYSPFPMDLAERRLNHRLRVEPKGNAWLLERPPILQTDLARGRPGTELPNIRFTTPYLKSGNEAKFNIDAMWSRLGEPYAITNTDLCSMSIRIVPPEPPGIRELKHWCQAALHFEPALEYLAENGPRRNLYGKSNYIDSEPFAPSRRTRDQAIGHIRNQHKMIDVIAEMQDYRQANVAWNFWDLCDNDPDFGNVRTEMDGMIAVTFNQPPGCSNAASILAWVELVTCFYDSSMKVKGLQDIMAQPRNLGGLLEFLKIGRNNYTNLDALSPLFPPNQLHHWATPAPWPFPEFQYTATGKAVDQDELATANYVRDHPPGREAKVALDSAAQYDKTYTGTSLQAPAQQRAAAAAQAAEAAARTPAGNPNAGNPPAPQGRNPRRASGAAGVTVVNGVGIGVGVGGGGGGGGNRPANPPLAIHPSNPAPTGSRAPAGTGAGPSRIFHPTQTRPQDRPVTRPPPMGGPAAARHGGGIAAAVAAGGGGAGGTPVARPTALSPVRVSGNRPRLDQSRSAPSGAAAGGGGGGGGAGGGQRGTEPSKSGALAGALKLLPRWK